MRVCVCARKVAQVVRSSLAHGGRYICIRMSVTILVYMSNCIRMSNSICMRDSLRLGICIRMNNCLRMSNSMCMNNCLRMSICIRISNSMRMSNCILYSGNQVLLNTVS